MIGASLKERCVKYFLCTSTKRFSIHKMYKMKNGEIIWQDIQ